MSPLIAFSVETPHILEAVIGGACAAIPLGIIGWLQGRDVRTRLVLKVDDNSKDIQELQSETRDHEGRIVRLETKVDSWGD